jgi:serine/threonine protein kinase
VVTKDELLESVWPGVMVVDGSLATAISKLRKALGDDDGVVVVTVPRVGYRLAGPVQRTASPPAWPDLRLSPGEPVPGRDQWRLVRRLDLSPSSEVWLAEHPKTHDARVFKFASDDERVKGLKREVTVARLLRESLGERPDFVRVLEWNFDSPPYFLETEYCGPNLAEWAERQGGLARIPMAHRLRLLVDVARAVAAAHQLDILHKDLKPGNILIATRPDGTTQIKIADFGSASLLAPARLGALGITNLGFTNTGSDAASLSGTLMYLAPEVHAGQYPTAASDVYALGLLLYQIVVGDFRKPLAPGWEANVGDPLVREDIAEAASGDPARRFKTAGELVERLLNLDRRSVEAEELARVQARAQTMLRERADARALRPWLLVAGLALLLAAAAILRFSGSSPSMPAHVRTVAVLPFWNVGADASIDFLRLALPDEIATLLSHARSISVHPSATLHAYDPRTLDLQKVGRELQVEAVVIGRFVRIEEQLQVTFEAIAVDTSRLLWRDTLHAPAQSLIAMQVQIALKVRDGLVPAFGTSVTGTQAQPKNEEAYDLFVRSVALTSDPLVNGRGIAMLEQAVALDPTYAPAWVSLARRYYADARLGSGNPTMMQRYEAAANRLLALDPNSIAGAGGLVTVRVERGDLGGAYELAEGLVRRRPDSAEAHHAMGVVLRYAGLLQESGEHCDKAFLIDPRMQITGLRTCAIPFLLRGEYPRAMNYLQLDLGSDFAKAFSIHMLVAQRREQDALALGSPNIPQWRTWDLLLACAQRKAPVELRALADSLRPSEDPEMNYFSAAHLAYCGQSEAALEMLRRTVTANYCSYPAIDSDPFFASLRTAPEFADIRSAAMACHNRFLAGRALRPKQ